MNCFPGLHYKILCHFSNVSIQRCNFHNLNPMSQNILKGLYIFRYNKYFSQKHNENKILQEEKPDTNILRIAIIGTPNAGKSTFINQIVGRRIFPVSSKIHTTRARARAVINLDKTQVVFLDTPGLVTQTESDKYKLETTFLRDGEVAMTDSNIIAVIHDVENRFTRGKLDTRVLRLLHLYQWKHTVLILNKVDTVKKKRYLLELADRLTCHKLRDTTAIPSQLKTPTYSEDTLLKEIKNQSGWPNFNQVFMVSALEGSGVGEVMEYLLQFSKPGKWMYPDTVYTDQNPEKLICDTVKSKLLEYLPQEVPYNCKVQLEMCNELPDGTMMAVVLIICPFVRYEKIVLKKIRTIAQETESDLRGTFMTQVVVKLVVESIDE